ncbi:hypothetical protein ACFL6R_05350 [Gemmatimonadota bacterium]
MSCRHIHRLALVLILVAPVQAICQASLAELYREGTIQLLPDFEVTDSDLPADVFFVGFEQSWSTSVDEEGNIYFADYGADHIKVFNPDGSFQETMGQKGAGPGEFLRPYFTAVSNGRLIVWDMGNTRFCILTLDGELLLTRPLDRGEEGWPYRLDTLPDGRILMHSRTRHPDNPREMDMEELRLYSPEMDYRKTIYEHEVTTGTWVAEEERSILRPFMPRLCWAQLPDGHIALGFGDSYRIEIHDVDDGMISSFEHSRPRARVTEQDRSQWLAGITWSQGGVVMEGAPPFLVRHTEFPRFMPALDLIIADSEGNLLVHTFRAGVQEVRFRYRYYDAFSAAGTFLGEVTLEGEGRFPILGAAIRDGCFHTGLSAETGEITFIRYRISP